MVICFLTGRYFDEISQDTGKYCFGVDDTLKALEMGAVDTLIVWENLDVTRFVLKNHSTEGTYYCYCKFSDRQALANSADPDQTAPRGAV